MLCFLAQRARNAIAGRMGDLRQATFRQLRPRCAKLLPLRSSTTELATELKELRALLSSASPVGLAGCLEYILFPLLFIVDSICAVRGGSPPGSKQPLSVLIRLGCCSCCCCWVSIRQMNVIWQVKPQKLRETPCDLRSEIAVSLYSAVGVSCIA